MLDGCGDLFLLLGFVVRFLEVCGGFLVFDGRRFAFLALFGGWE